ncbi:hypothetical protein HPB50_024525 [Hyalomma asiaticum]|uniref:Uncharacterized protein n=1 Tax=Hyalomma asiaticum TaxID=266040 RepID=A0ACB7SHV4_HYAAI|nr:hypothetical protein HPB50_024525 [Hyalomma asiaticum]
MGEGLCRHAIGPVLEKDARSMAFERGEVDGMRKGRGRKKKRSRSSRREAVGRGKKNRACCAHTHTKKARFLQACRSWKPGKNPTTPAPKVKDEAGESVWICEGWGDME